MSDLQDAKKLLDENKNYSCVIQKNNDVIISEKKGISPLLDFVDIKLPSGYSAADRIVGKAAALLYVLLKAETVYGEVMSISATKVFEEYNMSYEYGLLTKSITNRTNTGECPMEIAVKNVSDPTEAYDVLKNTVEKMKKAECNG